MRHVLPLVLLVVQSTSAVAQLGPNVRTGSRIRVETIQPEARLAIGHVTSLDEDSVVVERDGGQSLRLAIDDISALEVYRRGKDARTTGMVFGTVTAAGAAAVYISWCLRNQTLCDQLEPDPEDPDDDADDEEEAEPFSMFSLVTLGIGAIGYALGYAMTPPQWEFVTIPIRMGVTPMRRGVGLYLSMPAPRFSR